MLYRWIATALAAGLLWLQTEAGRAVDNKSLPQPDHVVVVVLENHSFDQIINSEHAPYISSLAANGALFVNAFAIAHPSQPNYFALFSGWTQDVPLGRFEIKGPLKVSGNMFANANGGFDCPDGVHVHQHNEKTHDDAKCDHGSNERF